MAYIFTKKEFVNRLKDMGRHRTKYRNGCWGQVRDGDLWYFDCICMIKGLLWGWTGDLNKPNGGAIYASNWVPDINEEQMLDYVSNLSTDFSKIDIGEYLWMPGHCGIYIGDGFSIECTPKFGGGIEITTIPGHYVEGYYQRGWVKHGKLAFIDYSNPKKEEPKQDKPVDPPKTDDNEPKEEDSPVTPVEYEINENDGNTGEKDDVFSIIKQIIELIKKLFNKIFKR